MASSLAGIRISVGRFTLYVHYSVALEYPDRRDRSIRDPRDVLFAVASLLQANAERFAGIDHGLAIELAMRADSPTVLLTVEEDPFEKPGGEGRKYALLSEVPARADLTQQVVGAICDRYKKACVRPATEKLTLFACAAAPCPGQVAFGSFPSTSLNQRFCLLAPEGGASRRHEVTRQQMPAYFLPLD
jgi:hypothetical protein